MTQLSHAPITLAVIGGSGLYAMPGLTDVEEVTIPTPFGDPSDAIVLGTYHGCRIAFLPRHGRGHRYNPSEVPYRANIWALKSLGVKHVVSVSACGSLREHLRPRDIVIPDQLFDFTKGKRAYSFFEGGMVGHVSVGKPFSKSLSAALARAVRDAGGTAHEGGVFITIEGPRFSTQAESRVFRAWGCDIIGMTACPEAFLAREAELDFAIMAHVTDYDVWHEEEGEVTVDMVIQRLNDNLALAQRAIANLAPVVATLPHESAGAMRYAVMTARDRISPEARERLHLLVGDYLS
ncbi:MAG: S-methyl-5'-thioadenosine phosphorylase [Chloroflexi bacterium]|jgi:5'-methylthioadenosine phosphorylase|uniref:S-methyl-5'-thioadenosine phosphorylase n=1 Tax=Candidatus Thermofonsia Clade 3 bacterium TaxID=2364212 RepID=A0A2M8QFU4_9CHLR|nr:S-methyl-5'-thioadenosine phosphorylase [Candidatus Roseilinea sp. NK_OTU-006]PJF48690.1 MAG: S-methyl-5'-thioadenosine phosphorylase [Candidatus Thermofonsia Clade 3 bacterium]RMG64122.1 MAG: S-methyl-5'-thioadenosine phosphorylase [Chloroflexota bacterium]